MLQGSKVLARLRSRNLILIVSQEGQNIHLLFNSDIMNYLLKTNGGRDKRPNLFFVFFFFCCCFFCSLECFKCHWVDGGGVEEKVLFRAG